MPQFKTRKLCSIRPDGHTPTPAGQVVTIDDEEHIDRLLGYEAIEPFEGEHDVSGDFGKIDPKAPALDADAFVAWVADGAKVGEVTDWIGTDLERATIASVDKRATVQKHIDALLGGAGDEEE